MNLSALLCFIRHDWDYQSEMIPEDRDTYECSRCGEVTMVPRSVGMQKVPKSQRR